eukprot:scaffold6142_cov116-Cylindrotheca_fusiformis.AAC.4
MNERTTATLLSWAVFLAVAFKQPDYRVLQIPSDREIFGPKLGLGHQAYSQGLSRSGHSTNDARSIRTASTGSATLLL